MRIGVISFFAAPLALLGVSVFSTRIGSSHPNNVLPSKKQVEYQRMELIGFFHFNMNTFTGKEWGYGDEDPKLFNPKQLDIEQWVRVAKEAGMKELILTAKHHDGFCLWPSAYTENSIKSSPYKNGKGDIVREFSDACRKFGVKPGLYLSPWDRNNGTYGTPAYIEFYKNQLRELLTHYGEIYEVWLDGANGGDGFYGGARETRTIDRRTYYPWKEFADIVYRLQPKASIFSDAGPDVRWIGNEKGFAGETFWSTINTDSLVIGESDQRYLNTGEPGGRAWLVGVCDVSIRPGWFYHENEDTLVKAPQELVDLYYKSVGRNAVLLLNIPPGPDGRIHENDIRSLKEFRSILDETFGKNLAESGKAAELNPRSRPPRYSPDYILDRDNGTYWEAGADQRSAELEIALNGVKEFDRIMLQEPVRIGQRISRFDIQAFRNNGWESIARGTTVGYKRILRTSSVRTDKLRILIKEANDSPAISTFALFKASRREPGM
ncbi:MAG TPA: alpha-L-fucosidase [Bacteroidota bacterium]|nr:alpha-L-fucosidase [Bacteroidota bacterium]